MDKFGVAFFQSPDDKNITYHFINEFSQGFEELGHKTKVITMHQSDMDVALVNEQLKAIECGLCISMSGIGINIMRALGEKFECDYPMFTMFLDPIFIYWEAVIYQRPNNYLSTLSQQDAAFVAQYSEGVQKAFQLNHGASAQEVTPWSEKDIDLFYCASLPTHPDETRASWAELGKGHEAIRNHVLDLHLKGDGLDLLRDTVLVLNALNRPYSLRDINDIFISVDRYLRDYRRMEALLKIAQDVPVLLAGNGWERVIEPVKHNVKYLGRIHPEEVRGYNKRSKVILNVINTYHESHERVFNTMADGGVVLSSQSQFYDDSFGDDKGIYFKWSDDDICTKIRQALEKDDELEQMALRGHKAFMNGHTWKHRAAHIIEEIFEKV